MGYTLVYTQVLEFFPYLIKGAFISLQIAILAFFGGMFFGLIFATIRTFGNKLMNNMVICYVTFFTNHVAGIMHRYWKYSFPNEFDGDVKGDKLYSFHKNSPTIIKKK